MSQIVYISTLPSFVIYYNIHHFFRNLFGGSVGPIRKQLTSGQFQNVYEGVKVRAQPLPLRVPTSPQQQAIQQQTQVNHIQVPNVQNSSQSIITPPASPSPEPNSPILTNLLHKKSPGNPSQNDVSITPNSKVCLFASSISMTESSPPSNLLPAA
jgi:hypothetical protein